MNFGLPPLQWRLENRRIDVKKFSLPSVVDDGLVSWNTFKLKKETANLSDIFIEETIERQVAFKRVKIGKAHQQVIDVILHQWLSVLFFQDHLGVGQRMDVLQTGTPSGEYELQVCKGRKARRRYSWKEGTIVRKHLDSGQSQSYWESAVGNADQDKSNNPVLFCPTEQTAASARKEKCWIDALVALPWPPLP